MTTQKFMGKNQLVDRLTAQVGDRDTALSILRKRGQMEQGSEELTAAGKARDSMTAAERAKDRASKESHKPASQYRYNPKTNTARLKRINYGY